FIMTHYLILLCLSLALKSEAKSIKKAQANLLEPTFELDDWQGKWFPYAPGEPHIPRNLQRVQPETSSTQVTPKDDWQGKWFPQAPGEPHVIKSTPQTLETSTEDLQGNWTGKWFPQAPQEPHQVQPMICDDGKSHLSVDYDPNDIRDSFNYLCLTTNRRLFEPNLTREAILTEHFLPSAFVPPSKCLNESIDYTHLPATNGAFRPLPAEYGSYSYLPPQRYLRNLAEGAILMLYHPCAFSAQVEMLQHMVSGCLYRHLVSPSLNLSPERPLALLAWSRSLEMSVVEQHIVLEFIQKYAKKGPLAVEELSRVVEKREKYSQGLLTEARLVTTADDYELCGYMREGM
ncbi:hypothetical protein KR018_006645, partial [Drosophila ironensis]